jgi:hypothetical protein
LVATNPDGHLPTLILNGDILELALAEDNVASTVFSQFIELAFGGDEPIFNETVYFVPGNHDHHLWEVARERSYAKYITDNLGKETPIGPPWHVTRLFEKGTTPTPEADLLNAVITKIGLANVHVRVVYPNLGIMSDDCNRVVIIHHGHFTEPLYRLMSTMKSALFPKQSPGREVWDWEGDNFAWIDFFWSTLGRSGTAGADVGLIYDMLQDPDAVGRLVGNLTEPATNWLPAILRPCARALLTPIARWAAKRVAHRERSDPAVLSPKSVEGLKKYLAGPVRRQLEHEGGAKAADQQITFVFGHTHKPFEGKESVDGFLNPLAIYNSGGWVIDTDKTSSVQGAAVILIDEECHVASLRMYNQADRRSDYVVRITDGGSSGDEALQSRLGDLFDFTGPPWSTFSEETAKTVKDRHRQLPKIIQQGIELT